MPTIKLDGIFVPHVTPFKHNGEIHIEALKTCVQFWIEGGVSGLVPCGSNGEAPYLSREERINVIETVVDETNGKVPVIAGTGSMSSWETIQFTKDAKDPGVDAVLVVTPFYFKLSNREILEHYKAVLEAVDLPIILYSVPKFTGFHLDLAVISQLASEYENVVGVKDSGGSIGRITEIIRLFGQKISVLAGTADLTLPILTQGGARAVIAVANVIPRLSSRLYEAVTRRYYAEGNRLQLRVSYLNEVLIKRYNQLSAIKTALDRLGLPGGYPRRPALPLSEEEKKEIDDLLKTTIEPS